MSRGTWQGGGTWQTTGGGGGLVLAVIAAAVLIGSGAASAIASALVTVLIVIGSVLGVAAAGGIGFLIWRARSERPGRPIAPTVVSRLGPAAPSGLSEPSKPALEAPRLEGSQPRAIEPPREVHLHITVSPEQLAAILRHSANEQ